MRTCSVCGTEENIFRTKHIPLTPMSGKHVGHMTLSEMTDFCPSCLDLKSKEASVEMDAFMKRKKKTK